MSSNIDGSSVSDVATLWTPDIIVAGGALTTAVLLVAATWIIVGIRTHAMRRIEVGWPTRLTTTARLNRVAALVTAFTLIAVVGVLAWQFFAPIG